MLRITRPLRMTEATAQMRREVEEAFRRRHWHKLAFFWPLFFITWVSIIAQRSLLDENRELRARVKKLK